VTVTETLLATPGRWIFVCTPGPQPDSVQTGIRLDSSAYAPGIRRDPNSHVTKERSAGRRHLYHTAESEIVVEVVGRVPVAVGGAQVGRVVVPPAATHDALYDVSRAMSELALHDKASSLPPKNGLCEEVFAQPPAIGMRGMSNPTIHRLPYLFPAYFISPIARLKMPQFSDKATHVIWPYPPVGRKNAIPEKVRTLLHMSNMALFGMHLEAQRCQILLHGLLDFTEICRTIVQNHEIVTIP
jgi:hypothetical protein